VLFCAFAWLPGLAGNLPTLWLMLLIWGRPSAASTS